MCESHKDRATRRRESLAAWYLRLNGFLTIRNFILHPDTNGAQRTEVDILGVRFPHRIEFGNDEIDEPELRLPQPLFLIAEVKRGQAAINPSWINERSSVLEDLLSGIGVVTKIDAVPVAAELRRCGEAMRGCLAIRLMFIGNAVPGELTEAFPRALTTNWGDVLRFVYDRFETFKRLKRQNDQWNATGRFLWRSFSESRGAFASFEAEARKRFGLPSMETRLAERPQ